MSSEEFKEFSPLMKMALAFPDYVRVIESQGKPPYPLDRNLYVIEFVKWVEMFKVVTMEDKT